MTDNGRKLKIWCGILLAIFIFFAYQLIDYHRYLRDYEEIDEQTCQTIIAKELSKKVEGKIERELITIIDKQLVDSSVIVGYVYTDYLSKNFNDKYNKGFLLFQPEKRKNYEKYYIKQYEIGFMGNGYLEKDTMKYQGEYVVPVSTIYNTFWTRSRISTEYWIFISDNPALEGILIGYKEGIQEIQSEVPVAQMPFMHICERPLGTFSVDAIKAAE